MVKETQFSKNEAIYKYYSMMAIYAIGSKYLYGL